MFGRKAKQKAVCFDKENQIPVIRCSICNGEQVAGFKDIHTGKFEEIMLIQGGTDLAEFRNMVDGVEIKKEY